MSTFIINSKKPLSQCSKEVDTKGIPMKESEIGISEWAAQYALNKYNVGDEVSEEQFQQDLIDAVLQETLDTLVEEGVVEVSFDGENFCYKLIGE